jgi:hypothetical protein
MCGGTYTRWSTPKHLSIVNGETVIARTVRLLKEAGVSDICLSTNNPVFEQFGLPILHHTNTSGEGGMWIEGFYPTDEAVCYIFGDVVFSPEAIKTIVNTDTNDIEFFASAPPFADNYIKPYAEPFAFKVKNQKHFRQAIETVRKLKNQFKREPIAWELWQVIKGTPINKIDYTNYTVINDYTCDVDNKRDIVAFNEKVFGNNAG